MEGNEIGIPGLASGNVAISDGPCGLELKNRVVELGWNQTAHGTYKYVISLFIFRLSDDAVLTSNQLQLLLVASAKFFSTNFAALSMNSNVQVLPEEIQLILSVPTTPVTSNKFTLEEASQIPNMTVTRRLLASSPNESSNLVEISIPVEAPLLDSAERTASNTVAVVHSEKENKLDPVSPPDRVSAEESKGTSHSINSPKMAIPKTWKPIPMNSPLRQGRAQDLELQKMKSLLNSATGGVRFCRNEQGALLVVTACSPKLLSRYLRHRMILFGLFAWYSKGNVTAHLRIKPSKPPSSGAAKAFPSAALNAMLNARNNPVSAIQSGVTATSSNSSTGDPKFVSKPPRPPPLPSFWPPVPYVKDHDQDSPNSPSPAKPTKSKYRAINLPTLGEIEGTFWNETPQFSVSVNLSAATTLFGLISSYFRHRNYLTILRKSSIQQSSGRSHPPPQSLQLNRRGATMLQR